MEIFEIISLKVKALKLYNTKKNSSKILFQLCKSLTRSLFLPYLSFFLLFCSSSNDIFLYPAFHISPPFQVSLFSQPKVILDDKLIPIWQKVLLYASFRLIFPRSFSFINYFCLSTFTQTSLLAFFSSTSPFQIQLDLKYIFKLV